MIGQGDSHDAASVRFQEFHEQRLVLQGTPRKFAKFVFKSFATSRERLTPFGLRKVGRNSPRGDCTQGRILWKVLAIFLACQPFQHCGILQFDGCQTAGRVALSYKAGCPWYTISFKLNLASTKLSNISKRKITSLSPG